MPTCIATSSGKIEQLGGTVARDGPKGLITINGEFTGSIVIAGSLSTRGGSAQSRAPIPHGDAHAVRSVCLGADQQPARPLVSIRTSLRRR